MPIMAVYVLWCSMPSHPYCGRWNTPTREKKGERMNAMSLLSRLLRPGGVHLAHHKDASGIPTEKMPLPTQIVLPMGQHIGAPCQPVVKKGDHVDVGTLVGKAGGFVSADIHSGVSGTVLKLDPIYYNSHTTVVVIQPDGQQTLDPSIRPPQVEDRESFLQAVRDCGLVGLGGAGFPTAVKLNPKNLSEIDTFIVNAAECEPYLCADHREMMECPDDVVAGIEAVMRWLDLPRCVIAIESNKPDAIALMKEKTAHLSKVSVQALPSTYPQGAEKVIIYSVTGRELPRGALPADVTVTKGDTLFPRIDMNKELAELEKLEEEARRAALSPVEIEPQTAETVDFDTFAKSDFRAVKVKSCEAVKKSDKLLKFILDDGTGTDRQILSGIHKWYQPEDLVGKTLIAIVNLPPRKMMGLESNGMLISAVHKEHGEEAVQLIMVDDSIPAGSKLC